MCGKSRWETEEVDSYIYITKFSTLKRNPNATSKHPKQAPAEVTYKQSAEAYSNCTLLEKLSDMNLQSLT